LRAEFDANAFSGRVEGGYRFVAPWTGGVGITPYAAGQFTTFDLPSYAESVLSGTGTFALAYGAKDVTDTRSELGVRTDKSFAVQDGILTLRTRFAWAHDYDPDRSVAATFQALPGASFVVNGAAQASDSALTTASIEMKWKNGWSAPATFEGEFSNVTSSYAGKGVVRYQWWVRLPRMPTVRTQESDRGACAERATRKQENSLQAAILAALRKRDGGR
jgi:uncharacterized protein with beta-barrel porin domain